LDISGRGRIQYNPGIFLEELRKTTKHLSHVISGERLSPLGTAATTVLLYQPQMIDDDDCGTTGVMKIGR
jgi:hypothetical protein